MNKFLPWETSSAPLLHEEYCELLKVFLLKGLPGKEPIDARSNKCGFLCGPYLIQYALSTSGIAAALISTLKLFIFPPKLANYRKNVTYFWGGGVTYRPRFLEGGRRYSPRRGWPLRAPMNDRFSGNLWVCVVRSPGPGFLPPSWSECCAYRYGASVCLPVYLVAVRNPPRSSGGRKGLTEIPRIPLVFPSLHRRRPPHLHNLLEKLNRHHLQPLRQLVALERYTFKMHCLRIFIIIIHLPPKMLDENWVKVLCADVVGCLFLILRLRPNLGLLVAHRRRLEWRVLSLTQRRNWPVFLW